MSATTTNAMPENLPVFVTCKTIARLYQVTPAAVRFWAKAVKIPSLKFESCLRFDLAAVRAAVEGKQTEGVPAAVQ